MTLCLRHAWMCVRVCARWQWGAGTFKVRAGSGLSWSPAQMAPVSRGCRGGRGRGRRSPGSWKPRGPALAPPLALPSPVGRHSCGQRSPLRQLEPRTLPPYCSLANKPQLAGGKGRESLSTEAPGPSRGRVWGGAEQGARSVAPDGAQVGS